jgi:hypothetical protein
MTKASDALLNEFISYYNADDRTLSMDDDLDQSAGQSAARLVRVLGVHSGEAVALLRAMAADEAHPLLGEIEDESQYPWTESPEDLAVFQYLAQHISDRMNSLLPTSINQPREE